MGDLETDLNLLRNQLNSRVEPSSPILVELCRNFIKKQENSVEIDGYLLEKELKQLLKKIEMQCQYTVEIIGKFQTLGKLQQIVRNTIDGQFMILNYLSNALIENMSDRDTNVKKLEIITNRIHERCQNCSKVLHKSEIDNIKASIGIKFNDKYEYFEQDFTQIHRLSQEAQLIYKKDRLAMEGICEQQYIIQLQKIKDNILTIRQKVTQQLNNIILFQERFKDIEQYQDKISRNNRQKLNNYRFNSKQYMVNVCKYFYEIIRNLEIKINKIKELFVLSSQDGVQTQEQFSQYSPERIKQFKQICVKAEIEQRQLVAHNNSLGQQLIEVKNRLKVVQQNYSNLKIEKQRCCEQIKYLQIELDYQEEKQILKRRQTEGKEIGMEQFKQIQNSLNLKNNSGMTEIVSEVVDNSQEMSNQQLMGGGDGQGNQNVNEEKGLRRKSKLAISYSYGKKQSQIVQPFGIKKPNVVLIKDSKESNMKKKKSRKYSVRQFEDEMNNTKNEKQEIDVRVNLSKDKKNGKNVKKQQNSSLKISHSRQKSINKINKQQQLNINSEVSLKFTLTNNNKQQIKNNNIQKFLYEKQQSQQKFESIKEIDENILQINLKKVYQILEKSQDYHLELDNYQHFQNKFKNFIAEISEEKYHSVKKNNLQGEIEKLKFKNSKVFKSIDNINHYNRIMKNKEIHRHSQNQQIKKKQNIRKKFKINGILNVKKIISQGNFDETTTKDITQQIQQNRKSYNIRTSYEQNQNKNLLENNQYKNLEISEDKKNGEECYQYLEKEKNGREFTAQDIKIVFNSIENAYNWNQIVLKHKKRLISSSKDEESLDPIQIGYLKCFFTKMASLHLCNKDSYEKIKLFLISPYDSVISQMTEFHLIKSNSSSNVMRQSLCRIIILHRNCTTRGDICKHLRYFMRKIIFLLKEIK